MNNKILILGKGYIAQRLHKAWGCRLEGGKIRSYKDVERIYKKYKPAVIINGIGHTGKRNVDDCELDLDRTMLANTMVPIWLGELAFRRPVKLAHISSGCIYHYDYKKQKPITESLVPDYYHLYYSRTKIYSEAVLEPLSRRCNILIARIRVPLDFIPNPRNILNKLIKYKALIDVPNSITYIPDFIEMLEHLIRVDARGIFNCTNKGGLRYPQLMDVYRKFVPEFKYTILPLKNLKLDRTNMVLSVSKLEKTGFKVRPITDVLEECVGQYVKY
ncbi:MAG: NAD-dependent epimerase/dehydratase family protein [Candidatus Omnitrophica bacterium]|nr:NAD-dependent epimerase/dehydratase family protein [Candidatus Omnitrophota bacterium]MDE2222772.1 NAD-dependent epimerase/dehydratase family protein [Candidatus Omnitrophota bacterium]